MDTSKYLLDVDLPRSIQDKLHKHGLLPYVSDLEKSSCCQKDAFYADGYPKEYDPKTIYPIYSAWYLGMGIPQTHLDVVPGYSRKAAYAAVDWLLKILPHSVCDMRHLNAETFTVPVAGVLHTVSFPTLKLTYTENGITEEIAVIPFPDSRENEEDWEGATTPSYADAQARFTLWCWRQSLLQGRRTRVPTTAMIVCISGNTAGETQASSDVKVRTIESNPKKEDALAARIFKAWDKAVAAGNDPRTNVKCLEQPTWYQKKEQERETAYCIDDEDLHDAIAQYMEARSLRKTLEAEEKAIKEEMDSLAVALAAMTAQDAIKGTLTENGFTYTVRHMPKRYKHATVTADLVAQFFPDFLDCVEASSITKGKITIETI